MIRKTRGGELSPPPRAEKLRTDSPVRSFLQYAKKMRESVKKSLPRMKKRAHSYAYFTIIDLSTKTPCAPWKSVVQYAKAQENKGSPIL